MFSPKFHLIIIASALLVQRCLAQDLSTVKTSSGRSTQLNAESQSIQNSNIDISNSSFSKSESSFATSEIELSQNDSNMVATGDSIAIEDSSFYASSSNASGSSSNLVASDGNVLKTDSSFTTSSSTVSDVDSSFVATPNGTVQSSSKSFSAKKSNSSSTRSVSGQFLGSDKTLMEGISSEEFGHLSDSLSDLNKSSDLISQTRSLNSLPPFPDSVVKNKAFPYGPSLPSNLENFPPKGTLVKPRGPNDAYSTARSLNSLKSQSSPTNTPLGPNTPSVNSLLENLESSSQDFSTPLHAPLSSTKSTSDKNFSPDELLHSSGLMSPADTPIFDSLPDSSPLGNDFMNSGQSPDTLISETSLNDISSEPLPSSIYPESVTDHSILEASLNDVDTVAMASPSSPFPESVTGDSILDDTILSEQLSNNNSLNELPFDDVQNVIASETESFSSTTQTETTYESVDEYTGSPESLIDFSSDSPLYQFPSESPLYDHSHLSPSQSSDSLDNSSDDIPVQFISSSPDQRTGSLNSFIATPSSDSSLLVSKPHLSVYLPNSGNGDFIVPADSSLVNNLNEDNLSNPSSDLNALPSPYSYDTDSPFTLYQPDDSLGSPLSPSYTQNTDNLLTLENEISPPDSPLESLDTDQNGFITPEEILESNSQLSSYSSDSPFTLYQPDDSLGSPLSPSYSQNTDNLLTLENEISPPDSPLKPLDTDQNGFISPEEILESNSQLPSHSSVCKNKLGQPNYPLPVMPRPRYDTFRKLALNNLRPQQFPYPPLGLQKPFSPHYSFDLPSPLHHPGSGLRFPKYPLSPSRLDKSNLPLNMALLKALFDLRNAQSYPFGPEQHKPLSFMRSPIGYPQPLYQPYPYTPGEALNAPLNSPLGPSFLKPTITSATFEPDLYQNTAFIPGDSSFDVPNSPGTLPFTGSQLPVRRKLKPLEYTPRPRYTPKNWLKISPLNSPPAFPSDINDSDSLLPRLTAPSDFSTMNSSSQPYNTPLDSLPAVVPHSSPLLDSPVPNMQSDSLSSDLLPYTSSLDSPISNPLLHPESLPFDSTTYPSNSDFSGISAFPNFSSNSPTMPSSPIDELNDDVFEILKQQYENAVAQYLTSNDIYPKDISPILHSATEQDLTYDIVIVGSSPAALTALKTLSDLGKQILLIERGRLPPHISKSLYYRSKLLQSNYVRKIRSSAPYCDALKTIYAPNVLGEESTYDSNVWDYGVKSKYLKWGRLCKKWTWGIIVNYFTGDLDHQSTCPIPTTRNIEETKATNIVTSIFNDAGLPRTDYIIGKRSEGLTVVPFLQENGENVILAHTIFEKLIDRTNINLALQTTVENIILDEYGKAVGVNVRSPSGAITRISIRDELILGSNPVDTVQLLYQSGIGQKERLQQLNLPVQINLPYVGKEFLVTPLYFGVFYQFPQGTLLNDRESDLAGMDYLFGKYQLPSALALDYYKAALNIHDSREANVVLNFRVFSKFMSERLSSYIERFKNVDEKVKDYLLNLCQNYDLLLIVPQLINASSRGEIFIDDSSGAYEPVIDTGMYKTKRDMAIMQKALKVLKRIAETETFKSLNGKVIQVPVEQCGEPDFSTEYSRCSIRYLSLPNLHYSGGTIMGVDSRTSVVNEDLLVHGTQNLRILSSSVIPYGTSTDSSAVSSMIGNYGAHIIAQYYQI